MNIADRMYRCISYGAYGDAFGSDLEMMSLDEIKTKYGEQGKQKPNPDDAITDDTQMTLFTLEGLVLSQGKSMDERVQIMYESYLRWFNTQYGPGAIDEKIAHVGELWKIDDLYVMRAPGHACIDSLRSGCMGTLDKQYNESLGNGTVMRSAPFGFLINEPPEYVFELSMRCAAITHGHKEAWRSAGVFSLIIFFLLRDNMDVKTALLSALEFYKSYLERIGELMTLPLNETYNYVYNAITCADTKGKSAFRTFYGAFGDAWIGPNALGLALYHVLSGDETYDCINHAANINGDSDTVASIAGNIFGAQTEIPNHISCSILDAYKGLTINYISSISPK